MRWRGHIKRVLVVLLALVCLQAQADLHRDLLIVELRFNGQPFGEVFVLTDHDGEFYVDESMLTQWQVSRPYPEHYTHRGRNYYSVSQFPGATARLIAAEMILEVTMPADLLPLRVVDLRNRQTLQPTANYGGYMDYDWNYRKVSEPGLQTFSGLLKPVFFGPHGNVAANLLYRNVSGERVNEFLAAGDGLQVLDLTYTRDDPGNLRSLRIGDIITAGSAQGRSLRLGGVQFATNFATRPTMITYPLPSFYGQATVPTALDIYVNGQLSRRQDVAAGSYILEDIPVINGSGQMQIVTEDALGRQQSFVQDFYVSTDLLREGLSDYSFNLGKLREDYGYQNFQYGDIAGSATWRYGYRDHMTVEGHLEFTDGLGVISGAAQYQPIAGGIISAGVGVSAGRDGTGGQWLIGYQQADSFFSYNVRLAGTTNRFALVGTLESLPALEFFASGGFNAPIRGSIGAAVTHQEYRDRAGRSIVSLNYSTSFRNRLSLQAVASYVKTDRQDFTVGVRFSMPFGYSHTASGGISAGRDTTRAQLSWRRSLPVGPGYGYHVALNHAESTYINAGAIGQNDYGTVRAEVSSRDSATEWQLGTSGSIATLGGMTRVTRQVRDAFAVVDIGEYEGVRVYSENREIGRTNKKGLVFIPGLRPYERNQISIEIDDLPLTARVGELKSETSPYLRSGVVVSFDVDDAHDAIIYVVLPDGTPVRQGAVARVDDIDEWSPVGSNGRLYLQNIGRSSTVTVRWNGTVCNFDIPRPEAGAMIPNLGEFMCVPRAFR